MHYAPGVAHRCAESLEREYKMPDKPPPREGGGPSHIGLVVAGLFLGAILVWWFFFRAPAEGAPTPAIAIEEPATPS